MSTVVTPDGYELAAKAAFLAHWPKDNWERFGERDFVRDQYRAIARAAVNAALADLDKPVKL